MVKKTEKYIFDGKSVVKSFEVKDGNKQIASGFISIPDAELLTLRETDPELANKDPRMAGLLEG